MEYMKKFLLCSISVVGILFSYPGEGHAFKVLDQSTYRLDAYTALFTITYEFGFLNADLWMPMAAVEDEDMSDFRITYVVTDASGKPIETTNVGLVLSDATLEENGVASYRYAVSKKDRDSFMLIGLVTGKNTLTPETTLQVTSLPFVLLKDGEINPSGQLVDSSILSKYKVSLEN
jgi:hypothetical protein